jgi:hypothetical protein
MAWSQKLFYRLIFSIVSFLQQLTPYISTQVSIHFTVASIHPCLVDHAWSHKFPCSTLLQKRMRENFPLASLLTSRSVNHGLVKARERAINDPPCQNHIVNYLKTGIVAFTDGTVCEASTTKNCLSLFFYICVSNLFLILIE